MPGAGEQRHYEFSLTGRVKSALSSNRVMASEDVKFAISVGMPSHLVPVGILINNSRLSDLRQAMDKRFDDTNRLIEARFDRMAAVMDAHLRHIEENRG